MLWDIPWEVLWRREARNIRKTPRRRGAGAAAPALVRIYLAHSADSGEHTWTPGGPPDRSPTLISRFHEAGLREAYKADTLHGKSCAESGLEVPQENSENRTSGKKSTQNLDLIGVPLGSLGSESGFEDLGWADP